MRGGSEESVRNCVSSNIFDAIYLRDNLEGAIVDRRRRGFPTILVAERKITGYRGSLTRLPEIKTGVYLTKSARRDAVFDEVKLKFSSDVDVIGAEIGFNANGHDVLL